MKASTEEAYEVETTPDDDLQDLLDACYCDPLLFIREVLRKEPRRWQREVCDEIRRRLLAGEMHLQIHVRAAHGSGKGWFSAALLLWWQSTRADSRCLTTAPNWRDVEQLLWAEIRTLYASSLLRDFDVGRMLTTEWHCGGGWFATGASSDHPENLEGQHSLIAACRIVDEAKAVDDGVFTATEGLLSSTETLDVWISTPSIRAGKFYERDLRGGKELIRKVVTIEDLIADNVPGAIRWKQLAIVEYGGEHGFEYQSRAMAQYIDNAEGALFPFSWIERAMMSDEERQAHNDAVAAENERLPPGAKRKPLLGIWHVTTQPTYGYDVAGSIAGDENAGVPVHGPDNLGRFEAGSTDHWHEQDTQVSKDKVIERTRVLKSARMRADVQGLGKGVCDAIAREISETPTRKLEIATYRAADPPTDPERFLNRKAEDAWNFRLNLEADKVRLKNEPTMRKQMSAIKYEVRQGKIRIIDPTPSPDHFDALLIGVGDGYAPITMDDVPSAASDFAAPVTGSGWGG